MNPSSLTFWEHAEDLRNTLLKSLLILLSGVIVSLFFYREIFEFLQAPLKNSVTEKKIIRQQIINESDKEQIFILPENGQISYQSPNVQLYEKKALIPVNSYLILERTESSSKLLIFGPIDGILITLKVCFFIGLAATSPLTLYFILRFIAPALEAKFYRLLMPFISLSILFMFLGAGFAFFATIPIANQYLTHFNQEIGVNFWSLSNYLDYTVLLLIGNAISFEMSVIAIFLVHLKVLSADQLVRGRRGFILIAFVISAILTPPDVFTQLMLATPLIFIYELTILYAKFKFLREHKQGHYDHFHQEESATD